MIRLSNPLTSRLLGFTLCLILIPFLSTAQQVDFNKVVVPTDYRAKTFEDYLVQLAWINSPENRVLNYEVAIAEEERKIQRWEWTKDLSAQFNYNEAHFVNDFFPAPSDDTDPLVQSLIFPRFNFGARIDLGTILNFDNEKQIKKLKVLIAESNVDQQKLMVRAQVLEQYSAYLNAEEMLNIRVQAEEDSRENYHLASTMFKAGEAKFEEFSSAATSYFSAKENTLNAMQEKMVAKIKLEEQIGITLEEAIKTGPKEKKDKKKKK